MSETPITAGLETIVGGKRYTVVSKQFDSPPVWFVCETDSESSVPFLRDEAWIRSGLKAVPNAV